jgi:predicted transcriptional regulator of viral defense system
VSIIGNVDGRSPDREFTPRETPSRAIGLSYGFSKKTTMNQIKALQRLVAVGVPVLESRDVAAILRVSASNATTILRRLAGADLITHLSYGRWLIHRDADRFWLPELISAPSPSYVSLQSALYLHGMIEQIPAVIYAATLGRTRRVTTPVVEISFHHLPPSLFCGFELAERSDAKIAEPEKALFDLLYLGPARSRLFASLPELSLPRGFRWSKVLDYLERVDSLSRRRHIESRIAKIRQSRIV